MRSKHILPIYGMGGQKYEVGTEASFEKSERNLFVISIKCCIKCIVYTKWEHAVFFLLY